MSELRGRQRRVLWIVLAANGGFLVAEVIGGLAFDSLALQARPNSDRHTFGLQRAEVLGALANGVLLLATAGWIIFEAIQRLGETPDVEGAGLIAVALIGLVVNAVSAVLLPRVRGNSLNMQGAFAPMAVDAAGSVAAIAAGVAIVVWGADRVDAVASIVMALLVVWSAWGLLRDKIHVLLEGTPKRLDATAIIDTLAAQPGVDGVHHRHLWSLASDTPALSAHLVVDGTLTMHDAQERGEAIKAVLDEQFGIVHATLEFECHPCGPDEGAREGTADLHS